MQMRQNEAFAAYKGYMETLQHFMTQLDEIDSAENVVTSKGNSNEPYGDSLKTLVATNEAAKKDADDLAGFCDRALFGNLSPKAREAISTFRGVLMTCQSKLAALHERLTVIETQLNSAAPDVSVIQANWESYASIKEDLVKALDSLE